MADIRVPRYALVLTANYHFAHVLLAEIPRGALVVAREDDVLSEPLPAMDMTLLSNPRRVADDEDRR